MNILDELHRNWWLLSSNSKYMLKLLSNGNLRLIFENENTVVWESSTFEIGDRLVMKNDGNLVLFDINKKSLFSTNTDLYGEYFT